MSGAIHRMAIPTPFMVGRVNCYLIEDDPLTLVDTATPALTSRSVEANTTCSPSD